jgi:phosphoribosyl-AMP cyclohydrolase
MQFLDKTELELGASFAPMLDKDGLIPAIVQSFANSEVLMMAYMNAEALEKTFKTRQAHFWSRSRQSIWLKGETSGQILHVKEIRIDCDQDTILLKVEVAGNGGCCHVGFENCFYRRIDDDNTIKPQLVISGQKL